MGDNDDFNNIGKVYRFTYKHDDKYLTTDSIILDDDDLTFLKSVIPTLYKRHPKDKFSPDR